MSSQPLYPLEQVLLVKKKRVEKAEKVVEEKKRAYDVELEKMKKIEEARDLALQHHNDKLGQLRKALDEGTTSDEVLQMKAYLKVVKERLSVEEAKVIEQKKQVMLAERNLEEAKLDLKKKRVEEEKISFHKEQWLKQINVELEKKEVKEQDEIGQVLYEAERRKKRKS